MDGPTAEQLEAFLSIPCKTHKLFLNSYPNSFTGKEAVALITNKFNFSEAEALDFGNFLIRGEIIEQLTNRFNSNFASKSNYIYVIQVSCNKKFYHLY